MDEAQKQVYAQIIRLWRRRWHALGLAWLICVVGWVIVAMLPNRYEAMARIYVDTETLLAPLLRGISVDVNVNRQIEVMQRTLLSRPNIENLLRLTDLDLVPSTSGDKDALVRALQADVKIRAQGQNLFTVSYEHTDPELAKRVVRSLLTIFVESNLGSSRRDMDQARRFIDDQIQQYERQLRAAEARLAVFKQRHLGELPETGNHAGVLEQARLRSRQIASELGDARTRLSVLTAQLASTQQYIDVESAPQIVIDGNRPTELELRITEQQKNLDNLLLRFTEAHPDVQGARRILAQLREQQGIESVRGGGRRATGPTRQKVPNALYDQIRLKLIETESEVRTLERRQADQDGEVTRLERVALSVPAIEAEYKSLDRDYQVIKKSYEELLGRREAARVSQEVEAKAEKVQFRLVDPPNVPSAPSAPDRPLLMSIVLAVALGAGVMLAIGLVQIDDSFGTAQQLKQAFALPILGSVSIMLSRAQERRQSLADGCFALSAAMLFVSYGGAMFLYLRPFWAVS